MNATQFLASVDAAMEAEHPGSLARWNEITQPEPVGDPIAELIAAAEFARHVGNSPTGYTPGADRRLARAIEGAQGAKTAERAALQRVLRLLELNRVGEAQVVAGDAVAPENEF